MKLELGFQWVFERSKMTVSPKFKKLVEVNLFPILTPCPNLHASRCKTDVAMTSGGCSRLEKRSRASSETHFLVSGFLMQSISQQMVNLGDSLRFCASLTSSTSGRLSANGPVRVFRLSTVVLLQRAAQVNGEDKTKRNCAQQCCRLTQLLMACVFVCVFCFSLSASRRTTGIVMALQVARPRVSCLGTHDKHLDGLWYCRVHTTRIEKMVSPLFP